MLPLELELLPRAHMLTLMRYLCVLKKPDWYSATLSMLRAEIPHQGQHVGAWQELQLQG